MVHLIVGKRGTGKTKILIDQINRAVQETNGCLVCIEKGGALRHSISYRVRWCDIEESRIDNYESFYGFIAGLLAGNYDIKEIYVDGILRIAGRDYDALGKMLEKINRLTGNESGVTFTVSADKVNLPPSVTKYLE